MQKIIIFSAILALAAAAPGYLVEHETHLLPLASKSTLTKSSQVVDHGSTLIHHAPVFPVVHEPVVPVVAPLAKSTFTQSSQVVDHGSTLVHHAPVLPVYHTMPKLTVTSSNHLVNHGGHTYFQAPVYSYKSGDAAISHQSSITHETVPYVSYH